MKKYKFVPKEFDSDSGILKFSETDEQLSVAAGQDKRKIRSTSRAALILNRVMFNLGQEIESFTSNDPYRVGLYLALEPGPISHSVVRDLARQSEESFSQNFIHLYPPKQHFKTLICMGAAAVSIANNIRGPVNSYHDFYTGAKDAFCQANMDLECNRIDLAIVGSVMSLEDELLTSKVLALRPKNMILSEGCAIVLLTKPELIEECTKKKDQKYFYGIADPLMGVGE